MSSFIISVVAEARSRSGGSSASSSSDVHRLRCARALDVLDSVGVAVGGRAVAIWIRTECLSPAQTILATAPSTRVGDTYSGLLLPIPIRLTSSLNRAQPHP